MTDRVHQREADAENYPRTHRWSRSNRKPRNSPGSTAGAPLDFEGRGGTFKSRLCGVKSESGEPKITEATKFVHGSGK